MNELRILLGDGNQSLCKGISADPSIRMAYHHLLGSKLDEGYRYLMKARHLAPQDPRIQAGFEMFDQERAPVISDLSREHPLNRVLGKLRFVVETPLRLIQSGTANVKSQELRARVTADR